MAGKHERAVHFYKTYLRYVPKAPNRADIEEKIKTGEQLAAQQAAGTLPPPDHDHAASGARRRRRPGQTTPPPGTELGTVPTPPGELPPVETPPPGYVPPHDRDHRRSGPQVPHRGAGDRGRRAALMYLSASYQWRRAARASSDIEAAARAGLAFDPATQERGQSAETQQAVWFVLGTLAIGGGRRPLVLRPPPQPDGGDDDMADRARALPRAESGRRHPPDQVLTMRTCLSRALLAAALSTLAASALRLQPEPRVGDAGVRAGRQLPGGLHLRGAGTCWRAGGGPSRAAAAAAEHAIGHWMFVRRPAGASSSARTATRF